MHKTINVPRGPNFSYYQIPDLSFIAFSTLFRRRKIEVIQIKKIHNKYAIWQKKKFDDNNDNKINTNNVSCNIF